MAGAGDEYGKIFRSTGYEATTVTDPAKRLRVYLGLARVLQAAERAREARQAHRKAATAAAPPHDDPNVVRLTGPERT